MGLKQSAISGVKWTSISTLVLAFTQILKVSILARFLDKSDFGLMAIVLFVLGFTNLFLDMGLTSAILYKQEISKNEYSSLYWLNIGFSVILFVIILFVSPAISTFYSEPELQDLIPLMGSTVLLSAFGRQFKTIEQKLLNFRFIAVSESIGSIISLLYALYLAIAGYGVYSLVYSAILLHFITNTIFLIKGVSTTGLLRHFCYQETKPFLKIGIYEVGGQVINYFNRDLDILIIGKFFGADLLGGYSLAKQLVFRPAQLLNPIMTKVASPILATFQNNLIVLRNNYLQLVNIVSSLNFPIYVLLIVFAPFIIKVMYGIEFHNIVPIVRILSLYMFFRAIGNPVGSLVIATGKTKLGFYWNLLVLVFMPFAILIGSQFSIEGVAICITLTMVILLIPGWKFLIQRLIDVNLITYLKSIFLIRPDRLVNFLFYRKSFFERKI